MWGCHRAQGWLELVPQPQSPSVKWGRRLGRCENCGGQTCKGEPSIVPTAGRCPVRGRRGCRGCSGICEPWHRSALTSLALSAPLHPPVPLPSPPTRSLPGPTWGGGDVVNPHPRPRPRGGTAPLSSSHSDWRNHFLQTLHSHHATALADVNNETNGPSLVGTYCMPGRTEEGAPLPHLQPIPQGRRRGWAHLPSLGSLCVASDKGQAAAGAPGAPPARFPQFCC